MVFISSRLTVGRLFLLPLIHLCPLAAAASSRTRFISPGHATAVQ